MRDLLIAILIFVVTWIIVLVTIALVLRRQLHRNNRVVASIPSPAPLSWLWSPTQPARLHRRLRAAITTITAFSATEATTADGGLPRDSMREEIEAQAVSLDAALVQARHMDRSTRARQLRQLRGHVSELETLSRRFNALPTIHSTPIDAWERDGGNTRALAELGEQMDLLESAHEEIASVEQESINPPPTTQ